MGRFRFRTARQWRAGFDLFIAAVLVLLAMCPQTARADYLPSIKIGTAALIDPVDANTFYGNNSTSTDGLSSYTGVETPTPPEISELARALKYDPDLIYQYVHNNIQTEFIYGLQKGALGAEIDKSGTPFDQAELMVALLRQGSTPWTASYIAGTVVLNKDQFSAWTGISKARAACQLLSRGGIPAQVNGSSNLVCISIGADVDIQTVRMAHVWVRVTIPGACTNDQCVFDPSYKAHNWKSGIDLASAMQFVSGDPLKAAKTGYQHGSDSDVPYASTLDTTDASGLNTLLSQYTTHLLTYIANHNLAGAQIEDLIGGGVIVPDYSSLRQSSLPYADSSPPYPAHVWTPSADQARYNAIPNKYRTKLTVDAHSREYTDLSHYTDPSIFNPIPTFYADEVYGRRLTIDTDFTLQGIGGNPLNYLHNSATLKLDGNAFANIPTYQYSLPAVFGSATARGLPAHIVLTADHPYAASANGSATTDGDYMDATLDKTVVLITPLTIVDGWGEASAALFDKWADERTTDTTLPPLLKPPLCNGGEPCAQPLQPTGDFTREKEAANWLTQFSRAAQLHTALANAVPQIHHVLGVVYGDTNITATLAEDNPTQNKPDYPVTDNFDRIDVDAGISFTSKTADVPSYRAALEAFAASSATLEGAMAAQMADLPDSASTATRFEWGNNPPPNDPPNNNQNPFDLGPQKFYQFLQKDDSAIGSLVKTDGRVAGSCSGTGLDAWGAQPTLTDGECGAWESALATTIQSYTDAGFTVVASREAFLGPGQRGGTILPDDQQGGAQNYQHLPTKQRGGAFVAIKYDGAGNPLEIAHIILAQTTDWLLNTIITKGGGGGSEPETSTNYDPKQAADILKSRFVDRSNLFGVNLVNGSLAYTSPISLRIGNGGFPYELSAGVSWHPGNPPASFAPTSPIAPKPGWVHSWENSLSVSSSGLQGMGQSDIRAAAAAIASFYAAQDIYKSDPDPARDAAAVLTQSWWARVLSHNVVTVNLGGDARQFIKTGVGTYVAPGAGYAVLTQTGSPTAFEQKCFHITQSPPYAMSRGWDYSGVSFQVTSAQGDVQNFEYFLNWYHTDDVHVCGRLWGFRLKNWTFPYGVTVTPSYAIPSGTEFDVLTQVQNSVGRLLTFSNGSSTQTITNGLNDTNQRAISYTQPAAGQSTITDQLSNTTKFAFVGPFNQSPTQRPVLYPLLSTITTPDDSAHPKAEYDYDSLGRVDKVKDATTLRYGIRAPYQFYLADGTRGERDDPLSQEYSVDYDTFGHPSRYIDELGLETGALFDSRGRIVDYIYPEGDCELFGYDNHNNTTSYQRIDKLSACNPGAGATHVLSASAVYDQTYNKPTQVTNFRGFTTTLDYYGIAGGSCPTGNGTSLLCKATRPAIAEGTPVYSFTYTAIGKLETSSVPTTQGGSPIITKNYYDGTGNLTSTVVDSGSGELNLTTQFGYTLPGGEQGDITSVVDPRGFQTTSQYDNARRKKEDFHYLDQSGTLNAAEFTEYDVLGRVKDKQVAHCFSPGAGCPTSGTGIASWIITEQDTYTPTSKLATVEDADNLTTTTDYDDDDRVLTVTDPKNRKTHFVYCAPGDADCAANQVKTELRAWAGSNNNCSPSGSLQECYRRVTYGDDGEQATIEDANNNTTMYAYDGFNRLIRTDFPDSSPTSPDYEQLTLDENGNVTQRRNRAGETLTYQYNALDWITQKCLPNVGQLICAPNHPGVNTSWAYRLDGSLDTVSDDAGSSIAHLYDNAGRLNQVNTKLPGFASNRNVVYVLDANGNRTKLTWPSSDFNYSVGYCFDNLNRMTGASENPTGNDCNTGTRLATYTYDPLSRRTNLTYGNGASIAYPLYSDAGDLKELDHDMSGSANDPHYSFTYTDAQGLNAHELQTEHVSDSDYLWQPSATGTTNYAAANSLNQYPSYTPPGIQPSPRALGYDLKGNLTSGNLDGSGTWAFLYDAENRLTSACKPAVSGVCASPSVNASYAYDPLGRRVHKSGTGVTERYFLDDGDDEIAEYDALRAPVAAYVPGPAIDEPIAMVTGFGGTLAHAYFHTNHQGSVIAMSDDNGSKAEGPYTYDPYGNCFSGASACSGGEPYRFTGRRLDPETGLYFYRTRYYSSVLGRFLQTDPVGYTADLNLYTYVGNDPANATDPTGNDTWGSGCSRWQKGCGGIGDIQGRNANLAPSSVTVAAAAMGLSNMGDKELRRPYIRQGVRKTVEGNAPRDAQGRPIDPNTGKPIEGKPDLGHKTGQEFRTEKTNAQQEGLSQKEFNNRMNSAEKYQLEDPSSNRSHKFEAPRQTGTATLPRAGANGSGELPQINEATTPEQIEGTIIMRAMGVPIEESPVEIPE